MKRAHILFAILVVLGLIGYRPVMTLVRQARDGRPAAEALTCDHQGRAYGSGEQRQADDGCNVCTCGENGWACTKIACTEGEGSGTISGTLSYPSEYIPAQRVCASSLQDDKEYCQQTLAGATSYAIVVPAGPYWVHASLEDDATGRRAYYSEFVRCGLLAECADHSPVKVVIASGGAALADPHDWYAVGQIDGISVTPSRYEYNTHNYYPTSVFRLSTRGLSRAEFYASPYPPAEGKRENPDFALLGEATLLGEERGIQTWTMPVPSGLQAMEVRPKGYSENGDFLWGRDLRIVRPIETAAASSTVQ